MAEKIIKKNCKLNKINYSIIRFPNLFGKWAKPNYNSVVATFSYNLNRNFKCQINNNKYIKLLYIDDAINIIKRELKLCIYKKNYKKILYVKNFYKIRLTELHKIIKNLHTMLSNNQVPNLKKKINKQLWSTILSYFPNPNYTQQIHKFEDKRGYFLEFLKSEYGGQISFLTLNPGESRGFHYHNTKFEKFLVISGSLDFISYDFFEKKIKKVNINDQNLKYVFSIPGYVHIIKNKSKKICKVLIWANEIFDKDNPDTIRV
jgi:UDP-2-acetamido-2,6-beta-L-arabino-hexul-4-ose reductase